MHLLKKAFVKNSFSVEEEEPQFDSRPTNQISSYIIILYLVQRNFTLEKVKNFINNYAKAMVWLDIHKVGSGREMR